MAQLLQLFQSLLTPAPLCRGPTARTGASLWAVRSLGPIFTGPFLAHIDREGSAVELQHALLEDGRWREKQEGPDGGEGPLLEALSPRAAQTTATLILPRPQLLQTTWGEKGDVWKWLTLTDGILQTLCFFYLLRKGSRWSSRVLKAVRRTHVLPCSSNSFSGCFSPDQNSGTTEDDRCICKVSSSQTPSSWPRPWLHSRDRQSERLCSGTELPGDTCKTSWIFNSIHFKNILLITEGKFNYCSSTRILFL